MGTTLPVFPGLLGRCISVAYPGFQDKLARSSWPETHRPDHVSNEEVYDRTGTAPLSQSVKARQTRFLGLCLRRSQGDLLVNQDMVDIKFYSTSMLESWSGQENSRHSSRNSYFGNWPQSLEAHGGRLLASLGSPMNAWAKQREARRNNEALGLNKVNNEHTATGNPTID